MKAHRVSVEDREPSARELAAIERERPAIEAELDVLNAEITILTTTRPSALDWRRLRRAEARVIRAWTEVRQSEQARVLRSRAAASRRRGAA